MCLCLCSVYSSLFNSLSLVSEYFSRTSSIASLLRLKTHVITCVIHLHKLQTLNRSLFTNTANHLIKRLILQMQLLSQKKKPDQSEVQRNGFTLIELYFYLCGAFCFIIMLWDSIGICFKTQVGYRELQSSKEFPYGSILPAKLPLPS